MERTYSSASYDDVQDLIRKGLTPIELRHGFAVFKLGDVERVRPAPDGSFEVRKGLDIYHTDSLAESMYLMLHGLSVLQADETGFYFSGPEARRLLEHQGREVIAGRGELSLGGHL